MGGKRIQFIGAASLHLPLLILAAVLCGSAPAIAAGPHVVFTIDVESTNIPLPDQIDAICTDGSHCGLLEIARILRARGWSGTFFLNVYEERRWGTERMRALARALQDGGHDVELHTHPQWAYDTKRWAMWSYSLDEQTRIIGDGKRMLEDWLGRPVVAHRAGAYTANDDTLTAVAGSGIRIDSSYFWRYPENHQSAAMLPRNLPAVVAGVVELPVTVFRRQDRPSILSGAFPPVTTVRKLDPNWLVDEHEMRAALDGMVSARLPVIVVFLHSFSFIKEARGGSFVADRHALDLFQRMVDDVSRRALPVAPIRDLTTSDFGHATASDVVPDVAVDIGMPRYLWHVANDARGTVMVVSAALGAALILVLARYGRARRRPVDHATATAASAGGGSV